GGGGQGMGMQQRQQPATAPATRGALAAAAAPSAGGRPPESSLASQLASPASKRTLPTVAEAVGGAGGASGGGGPVAEAVSRQDLSSQSEPRRSDGGVEGHVSDPDVSTAVGRLAWLTSCFSGGGGGIDAAPAAVSAVPHGTARANGAAVPDGLGKEAKPGPAAAPAPAGSAVAAAPAAQQTPQARRLAAPAAPASGLGVGLGAGRGARQEPQQVLPRPPPPPAQPQLPLGEALELLICVAEALRNLHRRGVTHGALTPQTIQVQLLMPPAAAAAAEAAPVDATGGAVAGVAEEQPRTETQLDGRKQQEEGSPAKIGIQGEQRAEQGPPQNSRTPESNPGTPGKDSKSTPAATAPPSTSTSTANPDGIRPASDAGNAADVLPSAPSPFTSSFISPFAAAAATAAASPGSPSPSPPLRSHPHSPIARVGGAGNVPTSPTTDAAAAATAAGKPTISSPQGRPPLPLPPSSALSAATASTRSGRTRPAQNPRFSAVGGDSASKPAATNAESAAAADTAPPSGGGGGGRTVRTLSALLPLPAVGPAVLQLQTWGRARPMGLPRDHLLWCAPEILNPNGPGAAAGQLPLFGRRSGGGSGGGSTGTLGLGPLDRSLGCRGLGAAMGASNARGVRGGGNGGNQRAFFDGSYGGMSYGASMGASRRARYNGGGGTAATVGSAEYPGAGGSAGAASGITPSCDVYSLGLLMWHVVSGQTPFHHLTTPEQVLRVKEVGYLDEQLPFSSGLPQAYVRLARRCWSLLPLQRPSIRVVLAEMRSLQAELEGRTPARDPRDMRGLGSSLGDFTYDSRLSFTLSVALSSRELGLEDCTLPARPPLELAFGVASQSRVEGGGSEAGYAGGAGADGSATGVAAAAAPPPPLPLTASLPPGLLTALTAPRAPTSRRGSAGGGGGLMDDEDYSDRFTDTNEHTEASVTPVSSPLMKDGTTGRGGNNSMAGRMVAAMASRSFRLVGCGGGGGGGGRSGRGGAPGPYVGGFALAGGSTGRSAAGTAAAAAASAAAGGWLTNADGVRRGGGGVAGASGNWCSGDGEGSSVGGAAGGGAGGGGGGGVHGRSGGGGKPRTSSSSSSSTGRHASSGNIADRHAFKRLAAGGGGGGGSSKSLLGATATRVTGVALMPRGEAAAAAVAGVTASSAHTGGAK
ncbi:hypothetical protein Agub_g10417, partial [Astrephomene gubernaculifera]